VELGWIDVERCPAVLPIEQNQLTVLLDPHQVEDLG
jgi:hypothetical protein